MTSTRRTTCQCGLPLTDGVCASCRASARRARRFRSWRGWLRKQRPEAGDPWIVRGRAIRFIDPMVPDE